MRPIMKPIRLAVVQGIEIRMSCSLGLMTALITFSLAGVVLPDIAPDYHTGWY